MQQDQVLQFPDDLIAGVDEAGRGPLAGPVVAAAVILPVHHCINGIDDSKKLSPAARTRLAVQIKEQALAWNVAQAEAQEIDEVNILQATMNSMTRAIGGLHIKPKLALIDGNRCPSTPHGCEASAVVGGDAIHACISAASILAKVHRDNLMIDYHQQYPQYGFDRHKGYPTAAHMAALRVHGFISIHRQSFKPVRDCLPASSMSPSTSLSSAHQNGSDSNDG